MRPQLRQFFDDADIWELSAGIDPENDTELGYYPLSTKGEVFPYFDPEMPPRLDPRPEEDTVFLQGMLEVSLVDSEAERAGECRWAGM